MTEFSGFSKLRQTTSLRILEQQARRPGSFQVETRRRRVPVLELVQSMPHDQHQPQLDQHASGPAQGDEDEPVLCRAFAACDESFERELVCRIGVDLFDDRVSREKRIHTGFWCQ